MTFMEDKNVDDGDDMNLNESLISHEDLDRSFAAGNLSLESDRDLNTTITDTLKLRKNLSETFDQLTAHQSHKPASKAPFQSSVSMKIAQFEEKSQVVGPNPPPANIGNTVTAINPPAPSENFSVYLRLRPCKGESTIQIIPTQPKKKLVKNGEEEFTEPQSLPIQRIRTQAPATSNAYKVSRTGLDQVVKEFDFAAVMGPETSQADVYAKTLHNYVHGLCHLGQSALLFCYGITNAGKTYTVTGPDQSTLRRVEETTRWGLLPRAIQHVFTTCQNRHTKNMQMQLACYEIYNEQFFDLLPGSTDSKTGASKVALDGIAPIKMVTQQTISTLEDGMNCISQARRNRHSGTNRINQDSSRSHAIYQVSVTNTTTQKKADLWIVDLAGSERSKRTGGTRQQEAASINQSLMTLNRCLTVLRLSSSDNESGTTRNIIPWRESKLTRLFASHWSGPYSSRTAMVVNVNPSAADFDETQHVLGYAAAARSVRLEPTSIVTNINKAAIEYDMDGRRKRPANHMTHKIVQAIRKLSPKRIVDNRVLKRGVIAKATVAEQPAKKRLRVDNGEVKANNKPQQPSVSSEPPTEASAETVSSESKTLKTLKMSLSIEQAESAVLKARCQELLEKLESTEEKLESVEEQVRQTVVDEMRLQMDSMRQIYEVRETRLRANSGNEKKEGEEQLEQANERIQALQEQVNECEEEMQRTEEDHREAIEELKQQYKQERQRLQDEIDAAKSQHAVECQQLQEKIKSLQVAISISQSIVDSDNAKEDQESDADSDSEDDETGPATQPSAEATDVNLSTTHSETNDSFDAENLAALPEIKTSTSNAATQRRRTSRRSSARLQTKVSSGTISEEHYTVHRAPLQARSDNKDVSMGETDDFIIPGKAPRRDPFTGAYSRPKGRKPKGAEEWDANRGAWRRSIMVVHLA